MGRVRTVQPMWGNRGGTVVWRGAGVKPAGFFVVGKEVVMRAGCVDAQSAVFSFSGQVGVDYGC